MAGEVLTDIKNYIAQNTRNKIVFCRDCIDGLEFINVGYELSKLLSKNSYNYEEAVRAILYKTYHDETIGNYLALSNIAILFEPELKINVSDILDTYSKNQCLIIQTDMEITNWVNLNGLSYKQI
jgi:hypothetical protein